MVNIAHFNISEYVNKIGEREKNTRLLENEEEDDGIIKNSH